jgi:hypothetical protein
VLVTLKLRKLASVMLTMTPRSAKNSEKATNAAARRGDFIVPVSAAL